MKIRSQKIAKIAKERWNHIFSFSSRPLRPSVKNLLLFILLFISPAQADPSARIELPENEAWTGQRLPFFIELRADGSFTGAASFDLPEIPNSFILKLGTPVLGSTTEGDTEFFTQRHEFALFSQASGSLEIPPITARFSHRKGYTGPSFDASLKTEPASVVIQRPPGSENLGFLVTTDSLTIEETWSPPPGPLETGAVLKRTITQRAADLTGIALAPAPTAAPDGIRVYTGDPEVTDKTERGEFTGERRETITYLVQQPGTHTLPAIRYNWWNPTTQTLESKTLPAVTFTATAAPVPPPAPSPVRFLWWLAPLVAMTAGYSLRRPITDFLRQLRERIDPPPRRAARAFLRSCRHNNAAGATRGWATWQAFHPDFIPSAELQHHLLELNRHLYDPSSTTAKWNGNALAAAFRTIHKGSSQPPKPSPLPQLNP